MTDDKWNKVRHIVFQRDNDTCVRCAGEAHEVHHRLRKGMGGTSNDFIKYGLANCVSLCVLCHRHVHANPVESYDNGFLVRSWDDPRGCPLLLANETVVIYLAADGNITKFQQQALF